MRKLSFGVLLIALATLILELMLTRVFDVILVANLAYFVVTAAVFAFGLAGIVATIRPLPLEGDISGLLVSRSIGFAIFSAILVPLINVLNLDYAHLGSRPFGTLFSYGTLYVALIIPFFLAGTLLIAVFSKYARAIQRLYFWDLVGAGCGSLLVVPLISHVGPGGLILGAAACGLVAAALFTQGRTVRWVALAGAVVLVAIPVFKMPGYIDFKQQLDKRDVVEALKAGRGEYVHWDPISKIDVIDETWTPEIAAPWHESGDRKAIQYDTGSQTSYFYKFDGDLKALRARLDVDKSKVNEQFWQIGVLASHYVKRDSGQNVLIIGSAGGQETKAALTYGAAHVDAVELVPTVVQLGKGKYASYIGNFMNDPRVHVQAGEGRSFLRSSGKKYDIIQIYSNHTNSSVAQGTGALSPVYLQTVEAYEEYFSHLTDNGILHVNMYAYPRMITTAALAWKRMGRTDLAKHVVVYQMPSELTLPTMLIKMTPWTQSELDDLSKFLAPQESPPERRLEMQENPLDPSKNFLSADFYSGDFPDALADRIPVRLTPRTDNKPYYSMLRKTIRHLDPDPKNFLDAGTAHVVNTEIDYSHGIPMDWIHLILTGIASLVFIFVFVLGPLMFSKVARQEGSRAVPLLTYFSCLGSGFIVLELVFIQKFTHLIGSPLYTYSTVIFTLLVSAGIGSAASEKIGITPKRLWTVPFIGVLVCGAALVLLYPVVAHAALALSQVGRVLVAALMIAPLGFFLGMPFPLGILAIENHPKGAIAWAWGMNGLFTVAGGFLGMLIGMGYGFNFTITLALLLYAVAFATFRALLRGPAHPTVA